MTEPEYLKIISDQCRVIGFLIGTLEGVRWHEYINEDLRSKIDITISTIRKESDAILEKLR